MTESDFGSLQQPEQKNKGSPNNHALEWALGKAPRFLELDIVQGFFRQFEMQCRVYQLDEEGMLHVLVLSVAGKARDFLYNVKDLPTITYQDLKTRFDRNYGSQHMQNFYRLMHLKWGTKPLQDFIKEFRAIQSQAAVAGMPEEQQVVYFDNALEPAELQKAINTQGPVTIQEAFNTAMRLEPEFARTGGRPNVPQNLNRIQCQKCCGWHFKDKKHVCSGEPRGGLQGTFPSNYRQGQRVNQAELGKQDAYRQEEPTCKVGEVRSETSSIINEGNF